MKFIIKKMMFITNKMKFVTNGRFLMTENKVYYKWIIFVTFFYLLQKEASLLQKKILQPKLDPLNL